VRVRRDSAAWLPILVAALSAAVPFSPPGASAGPVGPDVRGTALGASAARAGSEGAVHLTSLVAYGGLVGAHLFDLRAGLGWERVPGLKLEAGLSAFRSQVPGRQPEAAGALRVGARLGRTALSLGFWQPAGPSPESAGGHLEMAGAWNWRGLELGVGLDRSLGAVTVAAASAAPAASAAADSVQDPPPHDPPVGTGPGERPGPPGGPPPGDRPPSVPGVAQVASASSARVAYGRAVRLRGAWRSAGWAVEVAEGLETVSGFSPRSWLRGSLGVRVSPALWLKLEGSQAHPEAFGERARPATLALGATFTQESSPAGSPPPLAGPLLLVGRAAGGRVPLEVQWPGAGAVDLTSDVGGWTVVPMTPAGEGRWRTQLQAAPGVHRVLVRADGAEWRPPPGLPVARDEYQGLVGILSVE
jgi:hypothetical protein